MFDVQLVRRVASRYLEAKGGVTLIPEFKAALESLGKGDPLPMHTFGKKVQEMILPEGKGYASWYHGLGTAKRNALSSLLKSFRVFDSSFGGLKGLPEGNPLLHVTIRDLEGQLKNIRTLELASVAIDEDRVIKVNGFDVIPMPGVTKAQTSSALEALDEATSKLRSKFPKVIYGEVYFSTHLDTKAAAWYTPSTDKFYLNVNARKKFGDIYTIIHELGHRYDHKFLKDADLRKKFWDLSTRKEYEMFKFDAKLRKSVAEELLGLAQARRDGGSVGNLSSMALLWITTRYTPGAHIKEINSKYLAGTLSDAKYLTEVMGDEDINVYTDKLLHGPLAVTPYGGTKPGENFAEAFAHYVLGMDFHPELYSIIDQLK